MGSCPSSAPVAPAHVRRGRRGLLRRAAVAASLAAFACGREEPPFPRANVVLVSIDTLRADRLNAYGYRGRTVSPALDRLAGEGVLFENHISAAPWTTPSHMSLLTSLSPSAHGVNVPFKELMDGLEGGRRYPRLAGEEDTLAEVLGRHGRATAAFTGGITLDPRIGFAQGFELYDTSMAKMSEPGFASIEAWIREHRDGPFFLFWHTFEVHVPYLHGDFLGDELSAADAGELAAALGGLASTEEVPLPVDAERALLEARGQLRPAVVSALYDAAVLSVDRWVGRLVGALRREGIYESTLLVVTSDHGEQLGEQAGAEGGRARDGRFYNTHGHTLYEELLRVPLIVKLPGGGHAGQRVASVSRAIDVMPTILDVLGLLRGPASGQGASLRPRWEGRSRDAPPALSESLARATESKGLRTDRHKYIVFAAPGETSRRDRSFVPRRPAAVELFDLVADPGETRNLLASPDAAATRVAERLDAELRRQVRERRGRAETTVLDDETLERLEALGYAE